MNPFLSHALKVDKVFGIIGIEDEVGPLDPFGIIGIGDEVGPLDPVSKPATLSTRPSPIVRSLSSD
jgi:hypothetical protein